MSYWKENLSIASSTVIVGAAAYFVVPKAAPWSTLIGSATAATGANIFWLRKQQTRAQVGKLASDRPVLAPAHEANPLHELSVVDGNEVRSSIASKLEDKTLSEAQSDGETRQVDTSAVSSEVLSADSKKGVNRVTQKPTPKIEVVSRSVLEEKDDELSGEASQLEVLAESEELTQKENHPVIAKLESLSIDVQSFNEPRPSDVLFDQSALMLGDRYQDLERCFGYFYGKYRNFVRLSRKYDQGELSKEPNNALFCRFEPEDSPDYRTGCFEFFSLLKQNTLIRDVKWSQKDEDLLVVVFQKNLDPSVLNFINGFWLERYVYQKIKRVLVKSEQDFSYLRNVKIKSPETNQYNELDILFLIEGELLWCECTTGRQYSKNLEKYSHHLQKLLKLPPERTFLVLRSSIIDEEIALGISDKWGITVANESNLETKLQPALR